MCIRDRVYDVSVTDKLQFIVMEYIDGITLKEYMEYRAQPLTYKETLHFITQVLACLLYTSAPEAAGKRLKSLYDAAPEQARLSDELLRLVYYLKEHTFCTYYEAVKAIIPYGAQYKAVNTGPVPQLQKQLVRHTEPVYRRTDAPWQGRRTEKQQAAWDLSLIHI